MGPRPGPAPARPGVAARPPGQASATGCPRGQPLPVAEFAEFVKAQVAARAQRDAEPGSARWPAPSASYTSCSPSSLAADARSSPPSGASGVRSPSSPTGAKWAPCPTPTSGSSLAPPAGGWSCAAPRPRRDPGAPPGLRSGLPRGGGSCWAGMAGCGSPPHLRWRLWSWDRAAAARPGGRHPNVSAWPGLVLVTSTRCDVLDATAEWRGRQGIPWVVDPLPVGAYRLFWCPLRGRRDWDTGRRRAEALEVDAGRGLENAFHWRQSDRAGGGRPPRRRLRGAGHVHHVLLGARPRSRPLEALTKAPAAAAGTPRSGSRRPTPPAGGP